MPAYIVYARKSTESEDRQVLSIDSQIRELTDHARSRGITAAGVLSESRSAKAPGRQVFAQMMDKIAKGNVHGVICWKLDRLARNPIDGGTIIWALEEGTLKEIVTPQRTFTNNGDDKFWMQLEFGMAKKYIDDLSQNVKRGNRAKLEQGWLPGVPPLGYINDLANKTIVRDPDRFPLIHKMWDMLLVGKPVTEIHQTANGVWGFRSRKLKRMGGRPLALSSVYKMFSNPFYYGLIVRNGESYPGAHERMISKDEFDRAQEILGRPNKPSKKKHEFAFTGLIRCGECGAAVTAEEQINRYGSRYTYYHCTRRRAGVQCRQKTMRVENLEQQIVDVLERVDVDDRFRDWALQHLRDVHARETTARAVADRSLDEAYRDVQKQLAQLVDLRLRSLLTDEEYAAKRQALLGEQLRFKERLDDTDARQAKWLQLAEQAFTFAHEAKRRFENGSLRDKREILIAFGSNFTLKDKTLRIELKKPFAIIEEGLRIATGLEKKSVGFEPSEKALAYKRNDRLAAVISSWQGHVDQVRTFFRKYPMLIELPEFCRREED